MMPAERHENHTAREARKVADPLRAVLQTTFDGLRPEQIDRRWAAELGGLEAYVFDGSDLATEEQWRRLRDSLRIAAGLGLQRLTCHFPTENADWVGNDTAFAQLRRFCELAADHGARGVVLHANQFVQQADWLTFDVPYARARVVDRLAELDEWLGDAPVWIGMENLPLIGAEGTDYDPVFVLPEDFRVLAELNSPRIGATWDVCHWAVSYTTLASVAQLQQRVPEVSSLDLPPVSIWQIHFGSFSGMALPFRPEVCQEGVPPQRGDADPDLLARMVCHALDAGGAGVVFEIQETDYHDRKNCWTALEWLRSIPALRERCVLPGGDREGHR